MAKHVDAPDQIRASATEEGHVVTAPLAGEAEGDLTYKARKGEDRTGTHAGTHRSAFYGDPVTDVAEALKHPAIRESKTGNGR